MGAGAASGCERDTRQQLGVGGAELDERGERGVKGVAQVGGYLCVPPCLEHGQVDVPQQHCSVLHHPLQLEWQATARDDAHNDLHHALLQLR